MFQETEQKVAELIKEAFAYMSSTFAGLEGIRDSLDARSSCLGQREAALDAEQFRLANLARALSQRERLVANREAAVFDAQKLADQRLESNKLLAEELTNTETELREVKKELAELKSKFEGKQP